MDDDKERLTIYVTKEVKKALRREVIKREAYHGAQSDIVEEALREKFGLPIVRKEKER